MDQSILKKIVGCAEELLTEGSVRMCLYCGSVDTERLPDTQPGTYYCNNCDRNFYLKLEQKLFDSLMELTESFVLYETAGRRLLERIDSIVETAKESAAQASDELCLLIESISQDLDDTQSAFLFEAVAVLESKDPGELSFTEIISALGNIRSFAEQENIMISTPEDSLLV